MLILLRRHHPPGACCRCCCCCCAPFTPRRSRPRKGIGKKCGSCSRYAYIRALVLHTQKKKEGKDGHRPREGTWTKGPFVKKTFLSFILRLTAAVAAAATVVDVVQLHENICKRCGANVLRDFSNKALFLQ